MDKEYKISIEPKILKLLGPNLYTNIYFVLAELIANSYDAGASNVYIDISESEIIVEDDGFGMSYEKNEVKKFLNVAEETRKSDDDEFVPGTQRRRMGRKGVGKLAALSVSDEIHVYTRSGDEVSGFILSSEIAEDNLLEPVPEKEISFKYISGNGTAIRMKDPRYELHKRAETVARNIVKIFPQINDEFRLHIIQGGKRKVISSYDQEIVKQLGGLVTLGADFDYLSEGFDCGLGTENQSKMLVNKEAPVFRIQMRDNDREMVCVDLEIRGWIGFFKSTTGRRQKSDDFPDNAISVISHEKLGEYNVLPHVGKNALAEVYVVGQLHVDAFEKSSLPDMALSNRQGYKFDDPRYQRFLDYLRGDLLPKVIAMRVRWAAINKGIKDHKKNEKKRENEKRLTDQLKKYKLEAPQKVAKSLSDEFGSKFDADVEKITSLVSKGINSSLPDIGLKSSVDEEKKRILISHSSKNKVLADLIADLLLFNNVPEDSILYTSSDVAAMRVPFRSNVFEYIREFFVSSVSTEMMFVIYITSEEMRASWAAVCEVGAGWVVRSDHEIFNIADFHPESPLDVGLEWHTSSVDSDVISMDKKGLDLMANKIHNICKQVGAQAQAIDEIKQKIEKAVQVA